MWNKIISKLLSPSLTSDWNNYISAGGNLPKLFQNDFRSLLQLTNILQHVQCRWNNFESITHNLPKPLHHTSRCQSINQSINHRCETSRETDHHVTFMTVVDGDMVSTEHFVNSRQFAPVIYRQPLARFLTNNTEPAFFITTNEVPS